MISKENLEKIKEIIKEFFEKTTLDVEVEFLSLKEQTLPVNLKTEKPRILIGENGWTLVEIQRLLNAIVRRKIEDIVFIDLDISDYKKKKIDYLKELAISSADEVSLSKKEKELTFMPAYERRIIHLELKDRADVITESFGREPERGVIIKLRV